MRDQFAAEYVLVSIYVGSQVDINLDWFIVNTLISRHSGDNKIKRTLTMTNISENLFGPEDHVRTR